MESKDSEYYGECPKEDILCLSCDESPAQDVIKEHATRAGEIELLVPDHSMSKDQAQREAECTETEKVKEVLDSEHQLSSVQKPCEAEPAQTQDHSVSQDHAQRDAECTDTEKIKEEILDSEHKLSSIQKPCEEEPTQSQDHSVSKDHEQRDGECTDAGKMEEEDLNPECQLSSVQKPCETEPAQTQDHSVSQDHAQRDAECTDTEKIKEEVLDSEHKLSSIQKPCEEEPTQSQDHSVSKDHEQRDGECTDAEKMEEEDLNPECQLSSIQKPCETEPAQTQEQFSDLHNHGAANVEFTDDNKIGNSDEWEFIEREEYEMKKCPTCGRSCRETDPQCLLCLTNEACKDKPEDRQSSLKVMCTECQDGLKDGEDSCSKCHRSAFYDAIEQPFPERGYTHCHPDCETESGRAKNVTFQNMTSHDMVSHVQSSPKTKVEHQSISQITKGAGLEEHSSVCEISTPLQGSTVNQRTENRGFATVEKLPPISSRTQAVEDTVTIEFVALLSKDFLKDDERIVIIEECPFEPHRHIISYMEEIRYCGQHGVLIKGYKRVNPSTLYNRTLYYKYAALQSNTTFFRYEYLFEKSENQNKGTYCRVLHFRNSLGSLGGTWYQFDDIIWSQSTLWRPAYLDNKRTHNSKVTASVHIMKYIETELYKPSDHKCDFIKISQMLKCYKERFKNNLCGYLSNVQHTEENSDSTEEMVNQNLTNFIVAVTESMVKSPPKDELKICFFIVYTMAYFRIIPNDKTLNLIFWRFKMCGKLDEEFINLSTEERKKCAESLEWVCMKTAERTTNWVWLIPTLYAVISQGQQSEVATLYKTQPLNFLRQTNAKYDQNDILKMAEMHQTLIRSNDLFAEKVLELLELKDLCRDQIMQINLHPKLFLKNIEQRLSNIKTSDKKKDQELNTVLSHIKGGLVSWLEQRCPESSDASSLDSQAQINDILSCLNAAYCLQWKILNCSANNFMPVILSLNILHCFTCKEKLLKDKQEFQDLVKSVRTYGLQILAGRWMSQCLPTLEGKNSFSKDIDKWHDAFSTGLFTMELTEKWRCSLSKWLRKKNKQSFDHIFVNYQMFIKNEKYRTTQLDTLFSQLVLTKIEAETKHKSQDLSVFAKDMPKMKIPIIGKIVSTVIENIWRDELIPISNPQSFEESTSAVLNWILRSPLCDNLLLTIWNCEQQSGIHISNEAGNLVDKIKLLIRHVTGGIFSGAVPCNVMKCVLELKDKFITMHNIVTNDDRVNILKSVLNCREKEIKQLQKQLEYRRVLIQFCNCITDIIKVDSEILKQNSTINLDQERKRIDELLPVKKFNYDGATTNGEERLEPHVEYEMEEKLYHLNESIYFWNLWERNARHSKNSAHKDEISLDDVYENIYQPSIKNFRNTYHSLLDFSITLNCIETEFGDLLKNGNKLQKEFEIMEETQKSTEKQNFKWVKEAIVKIKHFREMSDVVKVAKIIDELRRNLKLTGDFKILDDLTSYDTGTFKEQSLNDITEDILKVKNDLSGLSENTACFLNTLLFCAKKEFISWIKTMIKDQTELSAFVELASISAGESPMDIDKVKFFRDAVSASSPIIFDLGPEADFKAFFSALAPVDHALKNDEHLPKKLKESCNNKDWLNWAHETHGSVERSSISQAVAINKMGIFIIFCPAHISKPSIDDCILLKVPEQNEEKPAQKRMKKKVSYKIYSLSMLTELQNKLVLISTKTEHGQEEVNRFLETLENVEMVAKLYVKLLNAGNIVFRDWTANIYCDPCRQVTVHAEFNIAGVVVQGHKLMLEELKGLCESMHHCLKEWKKYLKIQRDSYPYLNLFTSRQLAYLCCKLAKVLEDDRCLTDPQVLNLLSVLKHDVTEDDVRKTLKKALEVPAHSPQFTDEEDASLSPKAYLVTFPELIKGMVESGYEESVAKAALQNAQLDPNVDELTLMDFAYNNQDDGDLIERLSQEYDENKEEFLKKKLKFKSGSMPLDRSTFCSLAENTGGIAIESLPNLCQKVKLLWDAYCNKLTGLISDKYISLDIFGEMLKCLAEAGTTYIHRCMPKGLMVGKPNLVTCKEEEMLPLMLSIYASTREVPLPTYDEVLICSSETKVEDIELIIRRALFQDDHNTKIYSLFSAEKLSYKVARQLESKFYSSHSDAMDYKFIIFCDSKAHSSYVITAFDNHKVSFSSDSTADLQQYLKNKLMVSNQDECPALVFDKAHQESVKIIFSEQAGMGKSLFVTNVIQQAKNSFTDSELTCKTIRLTESEIDRKSVMKELRKYEEKPNQETPKIFHFDVTPVVSKGLYQFLIELCILRHIQSPEGFVWKCKSSHLYLIEYLQKGAGLSSTKKHEISTDMEQGFLSLFPTVQCMSPREVLAIYKKDTPHHPQAMEYQLMDINTFRSDDYQRSYQYLRKYKHKMDLDNFHFSPSIIEDSKKECLEILLEYCGGNVVSWTEICNFTCFLSLQLRKCENSVFCSKVFSKDLVGFKAFVIKFMITMAKDFAMPSLQLSDESSLITSSKAEDEILKEYQFRRKWEQQAHPYIIFHSDDMSMEFLGFHITANLHAVDAYSGNILEENVISGGLKAVLERQGVPFNIKYESLCREEQLKTLFRVFGGNHIIDPDASYQLTLDNTMKMMAIHLRFQANIPVIVMGDTGCGKTRLVQFMCELQRAGRDIKNMMLVRVHGGTTSKNIHQKVREAIDLAQKNDAEHNVDTVLFFDEANTTEAVFAIKEVLCDKSFNGDLIPTSRLKIVAACNPYKRHTKEAIEQLEKAGLGYRVRSEDTIEKLGYVPLRQLVYRVHPLPPSMLPLVWDFGQLNKMTQSLYIKEIVKSTIKSNNFSEIHVPVFTSVIAESQQFLEERADECRIVSLRDIERCMKVMLWFYTMQDILLPLIDEKLVDIECLQYDPAIRALVLAVGVCYYASLKNRQKYLEVISACISQHTAPALSVCRLEREIIECQNVFLDHFSIPEATARNDALRENVFMMAVCMDLRVPLFLVGKPGSSKSLSKTLIADSMQGKLSKNDLFKRCKQLQLVSFQCSPHSKPEAIISTFRHCAQFQRGQNLNEFASVVVLDEIGLAEDSPQMPLKTLHPLLEDGCVNDENPEEYKKVGFIGISNWSLDPAKMNRGLLVLRDSPLEDELVKTARGICASESTYCTAIAHLFPSIASSYAKVLKKQPKEFFGLRDFYSVIKMILSYAKENTRSLSEQNIARSILRNFGGCKEINPVIFFSKCFPSLGMVPENVRNTLSLLEGNLCSSKSGFTSRYLLLLTTNHAALNIIQMKNLMDINDCDIIYGSGFAKDQEYSQVCRSVNRVKICMETGRPVILLNIHNLYESLYDALNQCFVKLGGNLYVDLGLGTHRVKCRVKDTFKLIVIEDKDIVYKEFPTPLLNRLEKHILEMSSILSWCLQNLSDILETWMELFVEIKEKNVTSIISKQFYPKEPDVFIGYSKDTCATVILQSTIKDYDLSCNLSEAERNTILGSAKSKLIDCATPDSILRQKHSDMEGADDIHSIYFEKQNHNTLIELLRSARTEYMHGVYIEVSTYARLLNQRDREKIQKALGMPRKEVCSLFLTQFDTEQAFRQALRKFYLETAEHKLLLVQHNFDASESSKRLYACAKFCITDEKKRTYCEGAIYVVIITKLPRILGGCNYLGFSGGEWHTLHLDELLSPDYFPANLGQISRMTISEILENKVPLQNTASSKGDLEEIDDVSTTEGDKDAPMICTDFLIKQCIQKAIIQLQDKKDNCQRAAQRIHILYDLLYQVRPRTWVSDQFIKLLKKRIIHLLKERDKKSIEPTDWLCRRALSHEYVLEGASFRHAVWIHLEEVVAHMFAQILAIIDKDNNLDHISESADTSMAASRLWIQMFRDCEFLKIPYANKFSNTKILVSSTIEDPNKSAKCAFPFSSVLKHNLDQIWKTVLHNSQENPTAPTVDCAELFKNLVETKNTPLPDSKDEDMMKCYTDDFVQMSFPGQSQNVYDILSKVLLYGAKQLCNSFDIENCADKLLIWIHIQYFYHQDNYHIFLDFVRSEEDVIQTLVKKYSEGATEMLVEVDAANIIIEMLEPTDKMLLPCKNCLSWLKRVKSVKHTLELILSNDYTKACKDHVQELLSTLSHRWHCINIVYLLIDHLLHDETDMEESILKLVVKQFVFLWHQLKNNTKHLDIVKTFEHVTKVLKMCNNNAARVYHVKGVTKCKYCGNEITDPAELPCGHIFCSHCILDFPSKICIDCKKEFPDTYTPSASQSTREAVENHNKFRRKCNSFFIEFVCNYCFSDKIPPSAEIIEKLINFVACKPSTSKSKEPKKAYVYKPTSDLSPFEECMDPSPTVKSSLLKILLRCRLEDMEGHLQTYFSRMEDILKSNQSNQSNHDDFYFMVVRSIEDFIHSSQQEDSICKAEEYLFSGELHAVSTDGVTSIEKLQLMARIRFAISTAATVIGEELQREQQNKNNEDIGLIPHHKMRLIDAMRIFVENAATPWIQIFLIRNLCNVYKLSIMKMVYEQDQWHWILPSAINPSEDNERPFVDKFLMYGREYQEMMINVICAKEENESCLKTVLTDIQAGSADKLICFALAAARERMNEKLSGDATILTVVKRLQEQYPALQPIAEFFEALRNEKLANGSSNLSNVEDTYLLEVVLHAGLVIINSNHSVFEHLKLICFEPSKVKDMFLPTMPDDLLFEMNKWKTSPTEKLWQCSNCGYFWSVTNCGLPMEIRICICGEIVGGADHKPAKGFNQVENQQDKTEKGYLLGNSSTRNTTESERNLSATSFLLCRVLLHASMIWGCLKDEKAIKTSMKIQEENLWQFFWQHLEKDIERLATYIGNNADDASTAIHLFLKYVLENSTDTSCNVKEIVIKEDRNKWEDCWKKLIQSFFQGFDLKLTSVKKEITEHEPNTLLKIIYGQSSPLSDLPTIGLVNNPSMWRYEQRMTVQVLIHLVEQQDGKQKFPLLLELLTKHHNVQYIKYLPGILKLQQHLIHFFQNRDTLEWKGTSICQFMESENVTDDQRLNFDGALEVIRKVWSFLQSNPRDLEVTLPENILSKDIDDDTEILALLPTNHSIICSVTQFLIMLQNKLIDIAVTITKEGQRSISAEAVKPLSVITCVAENDLIPMALSNFQYMLEEDGTETTNYNFQTFQRQVINRFISGKSTIKIQTIPCITMNNERTLHSTIMDVKTRLQKLDPLSVSAMKRIMEDVTSVSDVSNILATLKVAAEFLAVTGGNPERLITDYIKNELKMVNKAEHFKVLPVVLQAQLKHILSLWQILSAKRSSLLVEMNQHPFFLIDISFQKALTDDEHEDLVNRLSTVNIDVFIIELHEMITVHLGNCQPHWGIDYTLEAYLQTKEVEAASIENLTSALDPSLTLEKVISAWKTAVETRKAFTSQH